MRTRWALLGMAAAAAAVVALQAQLPGSGDAHERRGPLPQPRFARLVSLGFDALLADTYWLEAVQLVGATPKDASPHAARIGRLISLVTRLDPWVDHPYRFAALWMTNAPESVRSANRILERGIGFHPEEWRNRFYLGFNHFFYLGERRRAAEVLEGAVELEGAPLYLDRLVARLRADAGSLDAAAQFLATLVAETPDERAREGYRDALREIEAERRARRLDRARRRFRAKKGRDIRSVRELARGPGAVLDRLPAEPNGAGWRLDPASGEIVSREYGSRYELRMTETDRKRQQRWGGSESGKERS